MRSENMAAEAPKESNWLGAVSIIFIAMTIGGLSLYQFVLLPGSLVTTEVPPAKEIVFVSLVEGAVDPNNGEFFVPDELTVLLGFNHTVSWTNDDQGILHTVTAVSRGTDFGGEATRINWIESGSNWNFTFSKPGEYLYFCTPHPHMRAVIHVLPQEEEVSTEGGEEFSISPLLSLVSGFLAVSALRVQRTYLLGL